MGSEPIKRDPLGRAILHCGDGGIHRATELELLLPTDPKWDVWKCGTCGMVYPLYMDRAQIEKEAKLRENPSRPLTERERIAQLEAEVARLRETVEQGSEARP